MTIYVISYSDYAMAQCFIVEADSKHEAIGKATEKNYGVAPLGECVPLSDVMDGREVVRAA